MDAMGILLSSMGIDPEALKTAASQVQTTATDFLARLDRIERKLDFIGSRMVGIGARTSGDEYRATFELQDGDLHGGSDPQH